jgi:hypothetical protein
MLDNDIERALQDDSGVTPSADFAGRIMVSVRQVAREREALAFPWRRLVTGFALCAVVTVAGLPGLEAASGAAMESWTVVAVPWLSAALVVAFLPAWWSFRLAGYRG